MKKTLVLLAMATLVTTVTSSTVNFLHVAKNIKKITSSTNDSLELGHLGSNTAKAFLTNLQDKLKTIKDLANLKKNDYDVYKKDSTINISDNDVKNTNWLTIRIVGKNNNFKNLDKNLNTQYIRNLTSQDTIYVDKNGEVETTSDHNLSNLETKEILQIGFYQSDKNGPIQVVHMPQTILKVPNYLPREITSLSLMFSGSTKFNQDLSSWDTSNVSDMSAMFQLADLFNGNVATWDTSKVTNMLNMFFSACAFNSDISQWDTSNVTNMGGMLGNATSFNINIGKWNTSKVSNMMNMFEFDREFNQDLSNWDTSNVTDMSGMFYAAAYFNQDLSKWNTSKVTTMRLMFYSATKFYQDLSRWDVKNVIDHDSFADRSPISSNPKYLPKWSK